MQKDPESEFSALSGLNFDGFWGDAEADAVGLTKIELAEALLAIGAKYNFGLAAGIQANRAQVCAFWHALRLHELALAQACALGREVAWQRFLILYREPLRQAAAGLARSASLGEEIADALYSEMFGLAMNDGQRRSPLASYSGRGSLLGFLRTAMAQRVVDYYRRTQRENPIEGKDFASVVQAPSPDARVLAQLDRALNVTMKILDAEERFLLSAWYLDQRTLLEIANVMRVHEATISRQLKRLADRLRKELLKNLQSGGMSRQAAEEALGTDPRDLTINIRSLLQSSISPTFLERGPAA